MILLGFSPFTVIFMSKHIQPISFEAALAELESIVAKMESGQLPLEQSLSDYKRGTELLQFCQKSLAAVEQQVRILNASNQLQAYTSDDE
jgi:exodeoxyribonuclease VII small subunit